MKNKDLDVRIYTPKNSNGLYYVYLYDKVDQKIIQKYYKGINSDPDPEERLSAAEDMQKAILLKLKAGWEPRVKKNALPQFVPKEIIITEALNDALITMRLRLKKKTVQCYTSTAGFIKEVLKEFGWSKNYLSEFETVHIEKILSRIAEQRNWTNNEYNKNITYTKAIFTELVRSKYIKANPAHGIYSRKKESRNGYETLTPQEQTTVINHFRKIRPNFAVWLKTLYHTGIRPGELRVAKCSTINMEEGYIKLSDDTTKTSDARKVYFPDDLRQDLERFDLSNPDAFIFGQHKKGSNDHPDDFKPSIYCPGMNAANKIWKQEVIDTLGIAKKMYSNKHKKASDIIKNGGSLEAVQRAFGHSRRTTTEIYAKILKDLQLQEFKEKSTDFK